MPSQGHVRLRNDGKLWPRTGFFKTLRHTVGHPQGSATIEQEAQLNWVLLQVLVLPAPAITMPNQMAWR